ncbi:hypothetical protein [Clostridium felsineum]|uniref:hypothetical protein n=1 Tax=Clostridium felsineum TaxID=36839 RepID=UPI00098BE882|nr:hypothetical protein [Clostridium felsineum]URZ02598.1 hypothetical protein CLAUR_026100 [Clostridium felsineum]
MHSRLYFTTSILLLLFMGLFFLPVNVNLKDLTLKTHNYNFNIGNIEYMDKLLANQRYIYSNHINSYYAAIITYDLKNASIKQYLVNNNSSVNLNIPNKKASVLSLPYSPAVACKWNLQNPMDNNVIRLYKKTKVSIPVFTSRLIGGNSERQLFYFSNLKKGKEKLIFQYKNYLDNKIYFKTTLYVNVIN